jgi:hypothetical protein
MLHKRPEKKVDAAEVILMSLLDMKAKCFGCKKSSGVGVARTGS